MRRMGFKTVILQPSTTFLCHVCNNGEFRASNFLLADGKSEFRFRKAGEEQVKRVQIESGPLPEYIMFSDEGGKVDYDCIEVTTVQLQLSLLFCSQCGKAIGKTEEEDVKQCGHVFHKKCWDKYGYARDDTDSLDATPEECPACRVQFIAEEELITYVINQLSENLEKGLDL